MGKICGVWLGIVIGGTCAFPGAALAQVKFDEHFVDRTLRVDYHHTGNATDEVIALDALYEQGIWAGSRKHLIAPFAFGRHVAKLLDAEGRVLLFQKTFDSIFGEYRTTTPATKGVRRTYHESVLVPFPKKPVQFVLEVRAPDKSVKEIFRVQIDPADHRIQRVALDAGVKVVHAHKSGDPHAMVDLAVLGEGYTAAEEPKFEKDVAKFTNILFSVEPFKSQKARFNVYGVMKASQESGSSEPSHGSYKNTALRTSFDALGSERYLLTDDNKALRDVAAHVPYDAITVMVNHKRYGGGGIYNLFNTFTTDNQWHAYIFVHELGHSFAGLADEYYSSSTAYNDFYPKGTEPAEPNITAMLDPAKLKWQSLVTSGTSLPTPWEKDDFDTLDGAYQKKREELNKRLAKLKRGGAPKAEIEAAEAESERLSAENGKNVDAWMKKSKFGGQVGAFLGAGYSSKGLYRPMLECIMFLRGIRPFCKVCDAAIVRMIDYYGED